MHPESVYKTAFVTTKGQWEWLVLPIGLNNTPSSFQRTVTRLLGDMPYVKVYLDDIIIHSWTVAKHVEHVCVVLACLLKY